LLDELAAHAESIAQGDPASAGPLWGAVHKLLLKVKADPGAAARVIATRDVDELTALIHVVRGDAPAPAAAAEPGPDSAEAFDHETLKRAMRAFRKRLKLTRLDHESKLGVGPMSSGRKHEVDAILPPREFPVEVWGALVRAGQLRDAGRGFFELAEEHGDA
jgi:hypothetical protein